MADNFPTNDEILRISNKLSKGTASRPPDKNASSVEKIKYSLCQEFVKYLLDKQITQAELAEQLGLDPSIVSKICRYNTERFTVDYLIRHLEVIRPGKNISILVA